MSRTELWEAPKDSPVEGHFAFTVDADEHVRVPYTLLVTILQASGLGLRRKVSTPHEPRWSIQPPAQTADRRPPPTGYRWVTPRECHGHDAFCPRCSPSAPDRRAVLVDGP